MRSQNMVQSESSSGRVRCGCLKTPFGCKKTRFGRLWGAEKERSQDTV